MTEPVLVLVELQLIPLKDKWGKSEGDYNRVGCGYQREGSFC